LTGGWETPGAAGEAAEPAKSQEKVSPRAGFPAYARMGPTEQGASDSRWGIASLRHKSIAVGQGFLPTEGAL